ncbi:MAG: hypothetical protein ABI970_07220 [Chloroflexota bacterium]
MFLDNLKLQLEAFQQILKETMENKQNPQNQRDDSGKELKADGTGQKLEIGNELLITDEIIKLHQGLSNALGRVVIIDQIPTNEGTIIKASAFGIHVNVDLKVARQMRRAYIARQ